jgi:hypothetical protein
MIDKIQYYLNLNVQKFAIDNFIFLIYYKKTNIMDSVLYPLYIYDKIKDEDVLSYLDSLKSKYNCILVSENND